MDVVLLLVRLLLAAVLLIAGLAKLADLAGSRRSLAAFGLPKRLAAPLGVALPVVELVAAVALIPSSTARGAAILSLALFVLFILGIAYVVLIKRRSPACNCFGALYSGQAGGPALVRNAILAGLALLVVARGNGNSATKWLSEIGAGGGIALGVAVLAIVLFAAAVWMILDLLGQNGRLLMRLESVEARLAPVDGVQVATAPAPTASKAAAQLAASATRVAVPVRANTPARPVARSAPTIQPPTVATPSPQPASVPKPTPAGLPIRAPAPAFTASNLDGELVTLGSLRTARKPILLIFGDLQEAGSNALLPEIGRWQSEHGDRLNTVLMARGPANANRAKSAEHGLATVLVQKDREIADLYRVDGMPAAVLVRPDGKIGSTLANGADQIRNLAQRAIETLAKSPPPRPQPAAPPAEPSAVPSLDAPSPAPTVGATAPSIRLPDLEGRPVDLAEFRGSDVAVLFWNPTCNFCRRLLPELKAWDGAPPAGAPRLLLVAGGSEEANRALGFRAPVLLDATFDTGRAFGAHGTPSAVLIDAQGRIASTVATGGSSVMALLNRDSLTIPTANGRVQPPVTPIGTAAPNLRLPGLDGTNVDLASLRGQRVLVLFWNPACAYCQRMLPDLRVWDNEAASDGTLLIVSAGSVEANRALGLRSTIVLDDEFRTARDFRASGTPSAVVIDEDGKIATEVTIGATGVSALVRASLSAAKTAPA